MTGVLRAVCCHATEIALSRRRVVGARGVALSLAGDRRPNIAQLLSGDAEHGVPQFLLTVATSKPRKP